MALAGVASVAVVVGSIGPWESGRDLRTALDYTDSGVDGIGAVALAAGVAGLVLAVRAWLGAGLLVTGVGLLAASLASGIVVAVRLAHIERDLREELGPRVTSEMAAAVDGLFTPEWGLFVATPERWGWPSPG